MPQSGNQIVQNETLSIPFAQTYAESSIFLGGIHPTEITTEDFPQNFVGLLPIVYLESPAILLEVPETNTGVQLTLPTPPNAYVPRVFFIFNSGTQSFTVNGTNITGSSGVIFRWSTQQLSWGSVQSGGGGGSVSSIIAGSGITASSPTGNVTVSNSGVLSVAAQASNPIHITGTSANPIIGVLQNFSNEGSGSVVSIYDSSNAVDATNTRPFKQLRTTGTNIAVVDNLDGTISVNSTGGTGTVSAITAGAGISVNSSVPSDPVVTNVGVTSAVASTGISVSSGTGAVTFTNTGVTSATGSTGLGVSASTGAVTFSNTGVTSAIAGPGIGLSGGTGAVTITNTNPTAATFSNEGGLGGTVYDVVNSSPTSILFKTLGTAGTGISLSNNSTNIVLTGSAVTSVGVTAPITTTGGATPTLTLQQSYSNEGSGTATIYDAINSSNSTNTRLFKSIVQGSNTTITDSGTAVTIAVPTGAGGVTSVTASSPLASSGGATPNITSNLVFQTDPAVTGTSVFSNNSTTTTQDFRGVKAGAGVSVTLVTEDIVVANTGVTSNVAGTGIGVSSATGASTISNTGVTSNVAGTGISVSGATGAVTIGNTGVTSIVAGTGISVSGATGAVTVNATGGTGTVTFANTASTVLTWKSAAGGLWATGSNPTATCLFKLLSDGTNKVCHLHIPSWSVTSLATGGSNDFVENTAAFASTYFPANTTSFTLPFVQAGANIFALVEVTSTGLIQIQQLTGNLTYTGSQSYGPDTAWDLSWVVA